MFKKAILTVFAAMLIVFGASISYALQVDGLADGPFGPAVPNGLNPSINPGGLGDSLLYGYYNVRGNVNLFNIVNTSTDSGAKVRIVFRSARNSRECLDFTICLSKGDVWTGVLDDNGTTARVTSVDTDTITYPALSPAGEPFKYSGAGGLGASTEYPAVTADDCREGYFEVIGMYGIPGYDKNVTTTTACSATATTGAGATLTNCIRDAAACSNFIGAQDVGNVLMGNNAIYELPTTALYSYNAIAVANTNVDPVPLPSGSELSIPAAMYGGLGGTACAAADYIFTKRYLKSPYDLVGSVGGETELILTFPTRLACHTNTATSDLFEGDRTTGSSSPYIDFCTNFSYTIWDDKEKNPASTGFSPSPTSNPCLQYEVNVIRLSPSSIWNSTVASAISYFADLGWINLDLKGIGAGTNRYHYTTYGTSVVRTTYGLPVVAYTTQSFFGGQASYMVPMAYQTDISAGQI